MSFIDLHRPPIEGASAGTTVGTSVGTTMGSAVGNAVGTTVGTRVGTATLSLTFFGHPAHQRTPRYQLVVLRHHSRHQTLVLALINQ